MKDDVSIFKQLVEAESKTLNWLFFNTIPASAIVVLVICCQMCPIKIVSKISPKDENELRLPRDIDKNKWLCEHMCIIPPKKKCK